MTNTVLTMTNTVLTMTITVLTMTNTVLAMTNTVLTMTNTVLTMTIRYADRLERAFFNAAPGAVNRSFLGYVKKKILV